MNYLIIAQFVLSVVMQPVLGFLRLNGHEAYATASSVYADVLDGTDTAQPHFELTSCALQLQIKQRFAKWLFGASKPVNLCSPGTLVITVGTEGYAAHLAGRVAAIIFPFHDFW